MKLSLLLLPALLALSSASLQDIVKRSSQHTKVSLLNPHQDSVPEPSVNISVLTHRSPLTPARVQPRGFGDPFPSVFDNNAKLKWKTWNGFLPDGSISIYNKYVGRIDYICKALCNAGFYNPDIGSYCHYPNEGEEHYDSQFEILVNEDNFEILEWKHGYRGSVYQNSIRTCTSQEIYVGNNKYGLGKVDPKNKAFFLPWEGKEYWYRYYEVLTINRDVEREHISNVQYNTNEAEIIKYHPETMRTSAITNNECNSVLKTATLSKTSRTEKRWDISSSLMVGIRKTFTSGVPGIASGSIEIGAELTFEFSGGQTYIEETTHSVTVELKVPPNHYCKARVVGYKYKTKIPFTAHLSRTYRNGKKTRTQITGTFDSTEIGEVQAVVERCRPITDAEPCP